MMIPMDGEMMMDHSAKTRSNLDKRSEVRSRRQHVDVSEIPP